MTQEAMKLALEWAEEHGEIVFAGGGMDAVNKMNSWVTAIKEALRENALREVQRLGQEIEQCTYPNCDYPCMNLPDCRDRDHVAQKTNS